MTPSPRIITPVPLDSPPTRQFDWKPFLGVLLAVVSLLISGFLGYTNSDKAVASRITAVETQQENDNRRLDRIENKVDAILYELRTRNP